MLKWSVAVCSAVCLAAGCSSSGTAGDVSDGSGSTFNVPNFDNVADVISENAEAFDRTTALSLTAPGDVPTSGTARFAGPILIVDQDDGTVDTTISGGMEIAVNFSNTGAIGGEAGNFYDVDGNAVDGTLTLSEAAAVDQASGEGFEARLTGTVSGVGAGDDTADVVYDIDLTETYVGSGVQTLLGSGSGAAAPIGGADASTVSVSAISERR